LILIFALGLTSEHPTSSCAQETEQDGEIFVRDGFLRESQNLSRDG